MTLTLNYSREVNQRRTKSLIRLHKSRETFGQINNKYSMKKNCISFHYCTTFSVVSYPYKLIITVNYFISKSKENANL